MGKNNFEATSGGGQFALSTMIPVICQIQVIRSPLMVDWACKSPIDRYGQIMIR